jgi:DNA recombination protein RmuC
MIFIPIILLVAAFFYMLHRFSIQRINLNSLRTENEELKFRLDLLNTENKEFSKTIEHLRIKSEFLELKISEQEGLTKKSIENSKSVLVDLGNNLSKQLIELHKQETKEAREFSAESVNKTTEKFYNQLEKIMNLVSNLNKDIDQSKSSVDMIKKSLLTPIEVGKFAEITLENILKSSGLLQNTDFMIQHTISNKTLLRPDAIIFLPSNNIMVIDAKSSSFMVHSLDQKNHDEMLVRSMNKHLKDLSSKEYSKEVQEAYNTKKSLQNSVMTFMFLPTEYVLERIYKLDPNFMERAWQSNIYPIGPAGLINIISLARLQINESKRIENYGLIIEEVHKLINSASILGAYSTKLGNSISSLVINYDKFAKSYNSNFLSKIKNLEKLGTDIGKNKFIPIRRYNIITNELEMVREETEEDIS